MRPPPTPTPMPTPRATAFLLLLDEEVLGATYAGATMARPLVYWVPQAAPLQEVGLSPPGSPRPEADTQVVCELGVLVMQITTAGAGGDVVN